jgi:hypothetical protein
MQQRQAPSKELARRLHLRARRVKVVRRRVGALSAALFLAAWVAVSGAGSLGRASGTSAVKLAAVHTAASSTTQTSALDGTGTSTRRHADSLSSGSSVRSSTSSPTAVTTRQS